MRGQLQAGAARLLTITPGRPWSTWIRHTPTWIGRAILRRRRISEERLELIERLSSEQRRARRSGEYRPELRQLRRWS